MTEQELKTLRQETFDRLTNKLGMSHEQANFVIGLTKSYHCALGGALYAINDYMDNIGV